MNLQFEVILPKNATWDNVNKWADAVVKNTAITTREFTKDANAYPYRTGTLQRSEVGTEPISIGTLEYGLVAGVDYAVDVYGYGEGTNWTNKQTVPHWYTTMFKNKAETIVNQAINNSKGALL